MNSQIIISVLLFISSSVFCQSDSCDQETYQKIAQCYSPYFSGFNLSVMPTIPEYWDFHAVRRDLLEDRGLHVQPYICQLGNALVECLEQYSCMGPNAYINMGASNATEAQDYWIDLAVTKYQCGAGYNLTMTEFYCMAFCRDRYQPNLDSCSAQFSADVKNGVQFCVAEQKFFDCQSNIYRGCCDFNAGVYICNVNLVGSAAVDPRCYNAGAVSCPSPR